MLLEEVSIENPTSLQMWRTLSRAASHRTPAMRSMPCRALSWKRKSASASGIPNITGLSCHTAILLIISTVTVKEVPLCTSCSQVSFSPGASGNCLQVPRLQGAGGVCPAAQGFMQHKAEQHSTGLRLPCFTGSFTPRCTRVVWSVSLHQPLPKTSLFIGAFVEGTAVVLCIS